MMALARHRRRTAGVRMVSSLGLLIALLVSIIGFAPASVFATTTFTQWTFNSVPPDTSTTTGSTDPATGTGTAALVGGTTAAFASGTAGNGSSDPASTDNSGWNVTTFAAQGAGNETRGVQFNASTVGRQNIVVSWDQRHSNTASRFVRFQYSTDGINFTNVEPLFEATGGDTWFNGRTVNLAGLPGVNNNPNFAFRIVAAFAPGSSAYVASNAASNYGTTGTWRFDMVTVIGEPLASGPEAPVITTEPQSQNIADGTTATLTVAATGTAPLSYQWYQGTAPDTTNPVGDNSPTYPTPILNATTSYWVRVSNEVGSIDSQTATLTVSVPTPICEQEFVPIYAIQGSGNSAAVTGNITTQGVVVGDFQGPTPALRGFYLQDSVGDGDATTSDGIFVFNGNAVSVQLGQLVRITGTAGEFQDQTQISSVTSVIDCGVAATVTPTDVTMPFPDAVNGVAYLERYEGMLVRFPQQLFATEFFQLGRFGQIVMSSGDRLRQPTNVVEPGAAAIALQAANNLNRIIVDDNLNNQNPDPILFGRGGQPLSASNTLRGGDSATGMVGVMTYGWAGNAASPNNYRLRPVGALGGGVPDFQPTNPRPTARPEVGGSLKVSAFNVLNYFLTIDTTASSTVGDCGPLQNADCRGADSPLEFERQRTKLVQALLKLDADILGLIEIENTPAVSPEGDLASALNTALGANIYRYVDTGIIGTDAIRVGFLYKQTSVQPVGGFAVLDAASFVNPFNAETDRNRPALAQTFREIATGGELTVVVNHLKSKGSACGLGDDDLTDGQGNCNGTRTAAALALMEWIATDPTGSGDTDWLIIGDLNAYAKEDPIAVIEEFGFVNLIERFGGADAYSYVFDGQWGYLDHALASPSLAEQVVGTGEYHINADEPSVLDYNVEFKSPNHIESLFAPDEFRTSDHDPVLIGLNLTRPNSAPALSALATYDTGLGDRGAEIISVSGDRAVLSNAGDGSIDLLDLSALPDINLIQRLQFPELANLTSVAIHPTRDLFVAVTGSSNPRSGRAFVFRLSDGMPLVQFIVGLDATSPDGRQPDSVEISPDGRFAVIAIEAEQVSATDDGGAGALVVMDLSAFDPANPDPSVLTVSTVEFPDISGMPGVSTGRTHGDASGAAITNAPGTIEPEGIAFAPDSQTVFVALQENNAIARLSLVEPLPAIMPTDNIFGLGQVALLTDRTNDGIYNPNELLVAFREPDGIRAVEIDGTLYLITADEGDTRPNPRGGRTISIFNATSGALVTDLSNQLADLANQYGVYPDNRSPNGGVEPEMLDVIRVNGRVLVAVGLERANAMAFVDITTPTAPQAFGLVRTGLAPESIKLIERAGQLFALSANEVSGTMTIATVPVNTPNITLGYTEATPRSFGLGAIDRDGSDILTLDLLVSPANLGTLSSSLAGLDDLGGGLYRATGNTATLNAISSNLFFTSALGARGTATVNASLSDGVNSVATGTINFEDRTPDVTPPTTTASISGESNPLCPSDCFAGSATVTLNAEDDRSGVNTIWYRVGEADFTPYNAPIVIATEGANRVEFFATDNAGNREAVQSIVVKVSNFPARAVLDNFDRADGRLGSNWRGATQLDQYRLNNGIVSVGKGGLLTWRAPAFGPDQEAFMRLSTLNPTSAHHTLALKVRGQSHAILVSYDAPGQQISVEALVPGRGWRNVASYPVTLQPGALLGARAFADGTIAVYADCLLLGTADTRTVAGNTYVSQGGQIGVWFMNAAGAAFDDFGGGNLP